MIMNKMRQVSFKIVLTAILSVVLISLGRNLLVAGEGKLQPQLHKVILTSSSDNIKPNPVRLKQGDSIIWYNKDKEPVIITFLQELQIVCSPIINFYADMSGYYRTGELTQGGTASLCFIRRGEYEYEVKRIIGSNKKKPKEQVLKGKVIVE